MFERTPSARFGAVLIVLLAAASPPAASRGARECPIDILSNKPWVQVSVNGSAPQWFILDSGSSGGTVIATECADRLKLARGREAAAHVGAGAGVEVGVADLEHVVVAVAGDTMVLPEPQAFSLAHVSPFEGRRLDGLLGSDFLRRHVVEIDYARHRLRILDPEGFAPRAGSIAVPITLEDGFAMANATIQRPNEAPIACRFVIDTGVRTTLILYHPFVMKHGLLDSGAGLANATVGGGVGGETKGDVARLERLSLGELSFTKAHVIYSRDTVGVLAGTDADGILGGEILRRCKTTFDYPHGRLLFEPYPGARPFEYDMSGLFLVGRGAAFERITVFSVTPGTPAAEAGLEKGDEIVAIDAKPASRLGLDGTRELLKAPASLRLDVRRGAKALRVVLVTRRLV